MKYIFPAYINPWCSIGSIDNINVDTKLNEYNYMENSFLNRKFKTNKLIKNVKYNSINENNEVHMLSSLKQKFKKVIGEENIRLNNKNSLIFNLKLKKQNNTDENIENEDIENYLRYDKVYYMLNHYKIGVEEGREYTVMECCERVHHAARWCGGRIIGHNVDMYLLQSNYIKNNPHISNFKFDPFNSDKEYLEYGDEVWIGYNHPSLKKSIIKL